MSNMQEALPREWIDTPLMPSASDLGYPDTAIDVHTTPQDRVRFEGEHFYAVMQGGAVDLSEYR